VTAEEKLDEIRVILRQVLTAFEAASVDDQRELIDLLLLALVTISRIVCVAGPENLN
jgi:hypothetical protein